MAVAPFSGSTIILQETADGISAKVYHWRDVPDGMPIPKGVAGFESLLFGAGFDVFQHRTVATRTALIQAFTAFVNSNYTDTPA